MQVKVLLKRCVVIWVVICILLSTISPAIAHAAEDELLNSERAGNYVANFAINFYENWSSLTPVETSKTNAKFTNFGSNTIAKPLDEGSYSESSPFGGRNMNGEYEKHGGIDYSAPIGTPVYSASNGKVVDICNTCTHNYGKNSSCGCGGGYGNNIKIDTGNGIGIVYGHLTDVMVSVGDTVRQGQQIGTVGTTGYSTGAHLHFELLTNNVEGVDEIQYKDRGQNSIMGFRYSVDPELYLGSRVATASMGVLSAGQKIFDDILLGNYNIAYSVASRDAEQIANNRSYSEEHGMDCSTFVSAALWLAGFTDFKNTTNTYGLEDGCTDGSYVRKYGWDIYKSDRAGKVYQLDENGQEHLISGTSAADFVQPGDVIVVNWPDRRNGHTNLVKTLTPDRSNKYIALDCGNSDNWQSVAGYNAGGGGSNFDIWSCPSNWDAYYGGTNQAFLIRTGTSGVNYGSQSKGVVIRGKIKTEYNSEVDPKAEVDPKTKENYQFNNKSWISFAYRNSIFNGDVDMILDDQVEINRINFDIKTEIAGVKDVAKNSDILNVPQLMSEGKILPGDILYVDNGQGGTEYVLYVGGAKVIYATEDKRVGPSGALKYEYMEYYLRRLKDRLLEGHEDDANFVLPQYGVTQVYRIKQDVASAIPQSNANLIFNGKGYYNVSDYEGIASEVSFNSNTGNFFKWLFSQIGKLLQFIVNLIVYMVRMQIVGWANLIENLVQHIVLGLSGDYSASSIWEGIFGTSATSASGDRITVESIFFNQIPILDANFFNMTTAGGHELTTQEEALIGPIRPGESRTISVPDEENVVYLLKRNLRTIYVAIRNLSIALLLFGLVALGIKIAISSSAEKKAEYKKLLISWVTAMAIVIFIHIFMYAIFVINDTMVDMCKSWGQAAVNQEAASVLQYSQSREELNLYDAIRVKAYAFDWREGIPATIIYIFMIYLIIRFLFIYLKRYLTIYILALSGAFMGVKYAFDKMLGKKTTSLNKWLKDFSFNVLLQTVHAFIYILFMTVALAVSQNSLGGALICFVILNFMLKADGIIIKIFGLDKAGSLADVNASESWRDIFRKFMPMYTISRNAFNLTRGVFFGERGVVTRARYLSTGKDNVVDAKKELERRKYNRIGWWARKIDKTPIRVLFRYNNYNKLLGENLSADTNKKYYQAIQKAKQLNRKKFTRRVTMLKDVTLGTAGRVAALAVGIADPSAGITMYMGAKRTLKKYRTPTKRQYRMDKYGGTRAKAKHEHEEAKRKYNNALETYTNNEFNFQEEYNRLLDAYKMAAAGSVEKNETKERIKTLLRERRKEKAKELHTLQEADENLNEAKINYGNAKHERNRKSAAGKVLNKFVQGVEDITGLNAMEDMAMNDTRASFKAWDSASKQQSKLKDMAKVAKLENELRDLRRQLKVEEQRYIQAQGPDSAESAKLALGDELSRTIKEARRMNVTANQVSTAVSEYLYETRKTKVTGDDINGVMDKLQEVFNRTHKKITVTDEIRNSVRQQLEKKMIEDSKGLGFDTKDATTTIRTALGRDGVLTSRHNSAINDTAINELHEKILHKINEINTYNEVGKVKYKDSLINSNKIVKDAKKQ